MSNPFVGEIRMFAPNFAPLNWALCQGQLIAISQNTTLFALLGTTYGGDGNTTFALPDLQVRLAVHQGQGVGLQNWTIGQFEGTPTVTLTTNQIPAHTHQVNFADGVTFGDETTVPTSGSWPSRLNQGLAYTTAAPNVTLSPSAVGNVGGSQPHDNTMPTLTMSYIISLFGIFPSQN